MAKKFALQYRDFGVLVHCGNPSHPRRPARGKPTLFDTLAEAVGAVESLVGEVGRGVLTIVGVEEIPGETKRELVPLEGKVDFDELSGFVIRVPLLDGDGFLGGTHEDVESRTIGPNTLVASTLSSAISTIRRTRSYGGLYIEGVREVSKPPMLRIISLEDALEAYDG